MELTEKHIQVIKNFIATDNQTEAWGRFFGRGNIESNRVAASIFFRKPEVKKMVKRLKEAREEAIVQATQNAYLKLYEDAVATDLELDIFHTKVIRNQAEMEEVFAVKEKRFNTQSKVYEEVTVFKRVKRQPTIKEKQVSASELYKRRGSYKGIIRISDNQDDLKAAELSKGAEEVERVVILSDGSRLQIPQ